MTFVVIIMVMIFVTVAVFGFLADKKRRSELAALAGRLGLQFNEEKDRELARRYVFLDEFAQGDNRYVFNVMSGQYRGQQIITGDYHYETESTDSKGKRETHDYYFSFFLLTLPMAFPELTIRREGLLSKIAQTLGYADIDFESHEFSRKFCVRSRDRKFAYDVCNARMIDYLLQNNDLSIEIERDTLAIMFNSRLDVQQVEGNLNRLLEVRSRMPDYLFTRT